MSPPLVPQKSARSLASPSRSFRRFSSIWLTLPCRSRLLFFNVTATTEIYTLSLHDALPIVPSTSNRGTLRLRHCTLVPGIALAVDGTPTQPAAPSLIIESDMVTVEIDHSIVGGIRAHEDAVVRITS